MPNEQLPGQLTGTSIFDVIYVKLLQKYEFSRIREEKILERLRKAELALEKDELEQALVEFNKVLFYDKTIPEVYVEKAEIYIKLCDFSSAISCFKKALHLKAPMNENNH